MIFTPKSVQAQIYLIAQRQRALTDIAGSQSHGRHQFRRSPLYRKLADLTIARENVLKLSSMLCCIPKSPASYPADV